MQITLYVSLNKTYKNRKYSKITYALFNLQILHYILIK